MKAAGTRRLRRNTCRLLALALIAVSGGWVDLVATPQDAVPPHTPLPAGPAASSSLPATLEGARTAMQAGRFAAAEATLRLCLMRDPNLASAHYLLAYALLREGKAREALAEYTRSAALQPPSAADLLHVGEAYAVLDDLDDASHWIERAVQMDPASADGWYNLGRVRSTQNRFADAVQCFRKTLTLVPRSVKAENNLGVAYEGLNRNEDAEAAYRQAIAWQDLSPGQPGSEQPLLNLATLLLHRGDTAAAAPLLARAQAVAPDDPALREQMGSLAMKQGRYAEAETQLAAASRLRPGQSSLHFLLGQAYKHEGKDKQAEAEFAEAARLARQTSQGQPR